MSCSVPIADHTVFHSLQSTKGPFCEHVVTVSVNKMLSSTFMFGNIVVVCLRVFVGVLSNPDSLLS